MEEVGVVSGDVSDDEEEDEKEEVDLFNNRRRQSQSVEGARRASLGLPDNGAGLTKEYYNIDRPMSVSSLVDLIVLRRTGNGGSQRKSTQLSSELEERIKKTLAWKEMEDELNKEDVMVNFRKKMRELRKEARQSIPKETKIERKINEERRIQLRTSLLEPATSRRTSTTESVKEAIQEFKTRQPAIIEEPQVLKDYEEDKETSDIIHRTRELLEQMGYLKRRKEMIQEELSSVSKGETSNTKSEDEGSHESNKKKRASQSASEKSLGAPPGKSKSKSRVSSSSRTNQDSGRWSGQRSSRQAPSSASSKPSHSAARSSPRGSLPGQPRRTPSELVRHSRS